MKNWTTPLLLLVALLTLAGCSTSSNEIIATGIKIELTKVERASDGVIHVSWQVNNPNIVSYLIDRSVQKVTLDGEMIGTFSDDTRLGVPPQSKAGHTAVLKPANPQAGERVAQLAAKGTASYKVEGSISLLIYDDQISRSNISGSGSVPVVAK